MFYTNQSPAFRFCMTPICFVAATLAGFQMASQQAVAQSLFFVESPVRFDDQGAPDPQAEARMFSLILVEPPEPPTFQTHDLIYVIIDEIASTSSSQTLETTKEFDEQNDLNSVLDPVEALQLRLRASNLQNLSLIDLATSREFTGEGTYDRSDRVRARVAATIIDVKPNGTLILEARKTVLTDEESRTIVLTGVCRQEDITSQNTILSSQLANLELSMQHSGELKSAATKGLFTRVIETLFNF